MKMLQGDYTAIYILCCVTKVDYIVVTMKEDEFFFIISRSHDTFFTSRMNFFRHVLIPLKFNPQSLGWVMLERT